MCILCSLPISIRAQQEKEKWQRVYTGEESLIEINVSNFSFEPEGILRVRYRTIMSKPETVKETPGAKYKSRLETIDFKLNEKRYRLRETTLLDSIGKTVQSYEANSADDWKILKAGGIMERLFYAARALPPFGSWKAIAYRFGDGSPNGAIRAPELAKLIGTRVRLESDRAEVGLKVCSSPAYQSRRFTGEEFNRELGVQLESIGMKKKYVDTVSVKCEGNGWEPPQSLLVKVAKGDVLMLWDGVFLVLKRERHWTRTFPALLKRYRE